MIILGIETSCDETAAAVLKINHSDLIILAENVSSQIALHKKWGGVVPELAARRHVDIILPLINQTLTGAKIKPQELDALAVTGGPGLIIALQVGVETAKTLSWLWQKPLINVNHLEGHLSSPFLNQNSWSLINKKNTWPALALIVSGGHTELHLLKGLGQYQMIGRTLDDAAGEAFDKVAKMLNLGYPGGPKVSRLALEGNTAAFSFPRPMINKPDFNFSFAGLKTAVLYTLKKYKPSAIDHLLKANICASFQQAVVDTLVNKTIKAAKKYKTYTISLSGGVAANQLLRLSLTNAVNKFLSHSRCLVSPLKYAGDNATMIALAGYIKVRSKKLSNHLNNWQKINANANWELW